MVYTVTLNPALDYEVLVDGFRAGGLNRTSREHMHFGGKGVNVSTVLHSLGVDTTALGFVAGFTGKALEDGLKAGGIPTDFVWLEEGLTRVNVKIRSGGGGGETEINSQGPAIPAPALEALLQKLDRLTGGDVLVLAGSLPAGLPGDVYQTILARVEGRGVLTVVDAARDLLKGVLPCRPFLIKPNSAELGELFGRVPSRRRRKFSPAPKASRLREPGTSWSPWPGTGRCCWTKPAGSAAWGCPRERSATRWARGIPWWPGSWPDGWKPGTTPPPTSWGPPPAPPPPFPTVWPEGRRSGPFWRRSELHISTFSSAGERYTAS